MSAIIRNTLAFGALSLLASAQKLDAGCSDVVIFMARGNDAPYHDGRTTPFIDATCAKLTAQGTSCDYIDIQFDVTLGGNYCNQVAEGARNGVSQITAFNAKCPNTHIVVNGYSEGAHVAGDVLGGPGGCTFVSTGIDPNSQAGKAIGAALLWGNVMHTANQPYNVLDGASKQANPRKPEDLARLNRYSSVLRDYCAAGDPVCAKGDVIAQHLNYFELYTDEASSWVVSMINKLKPTTSSSSTLATSTKSASATGGSSAYPTVTGGYNATATATGGSGYPTGEVSGTATLPGYATETDVETATATTSCTTSAASAVVPAPSSAGMSYPSAVPAFPAPVPYPQDSCALVVKVEYVYV